MAKLLNRSRPDEAQFERVELANSNWGTRLQPYLAAKTKVLVPEIRLNEIPLLEELVVKAGYEVSYVLVSAARGMGKAYLIPKAAL